MPTSTAISELGISLEDIRKLLDAKTIVLASGCHEWQNAKHDWGYGLITIKRKQFYVHRLSWEIENGPIPKGMMVRHFICNNPPCRNIEHLRLGTHKQNMEDMIKAGRQRKSMNKIHCPSGHEYTIKNTRLYKGKRICRECDRLRSIPRNKQRAIVKAGMQNEI